jgi:hypothetical protein
MKKAILVVVLLVLLSPASAAARGRLDPTFGVGGRMVQGTDGFLTYGLERKAVMSPDGRVYVLSGETTVIAFEPDGAIAAGFGIGGSIAVLQPHEAAGPVSLAVDHQGRVLVATTIDPPEPRYTYVGEPPPSLPDAPKAILIARFTSSGRPDPGFGTEGRLVTQLGLDSPGLPPGSESHSKQPPPPRVTAAAIAVDAAGRPVLSGTHLAGYEPCSGIAGSRPRWESFVARLGDDGQPDPSFGTNGVRILGEGPLGPPVPDEAGGLYVSLGTPLPCLPSTRVSIGYLFHLDESGNPVAGFGQGGFRYIPEDPYVKMAPDGRGGLLLMPASPEWRRSLILRRLLPNGTWDRSFGFKSVAEPFVAPKGKLSFADFALGRDGRIFVTGSWTRKARGTGAIHRFLLFSLDRGGRLDRDYGVLRTGFGKGTTAFSRFVLTTPEGNPLVIGTIGSPLLPGGAGLALARYSTS